MFDEAVGYCFREIGNGVADSWLMPMDKQVIYHEKRQYYIHVIEFGEIKNKACNSSDSFDYFFL